MIEESESEVLKDTVKSQLENKNSIKVSSLKDYDFLFIIEDSYAVPIRSFQDKEYGIPSKDITDLVTQIVLETL